MSFNFLYFGEVGERDMSGVRWEEDEFGRVGWVDWWGRDWGWRGYLKGCCKIGFFDKELS